jgi:HD-like signal output (HDOD) protein
LELRSNYDCAVMLRIATASKPLPAAPKLYQSLTLLLSDENSKIEDVAYLMANDVSMSSSILKIANSSFFNISSSIDNIEKAVIVLGIDVIRNLVLVNEIINCYDSGSFKWLDIEKLWQQSFLSADIARKISSSCSSQKHILDQTYTAGIMQNIGIVVLAESLGKEYQEVYESSLVQTQLGEDRMIDFTELARLEVERFGFTHHQLAAYMLKLWDLSDSIIEGVCFSHSYICDNGSLPQKFLFISNEILAYHLLATPISSEVLEQINALGQTIENVVVLSKKRLNQ